MKKILAWLLCLTLCLFSFAAFADDEALSVSAAGVTTEICTYSAENDILTVSLAENATTGFSWEYELSADGILSYQSDEYVPAEGSEETVGAGGTRTFKFKAESAGETTIHFDCVQPFDPMNTPAGCVTISLTVDESKKITVNEMKPSDEQEIDAKPLHLNGDADEESHFGVAIGFIDAAELLLTENPSTGYTWQVTQPDAGILAILTDSYVEPVGDEYSAGAAGTHHWLWDARGAGEAVVTAEYSRVWENDAPLYAVNVTFTVDENRKVTVKEATIKSSAAPSALTFTGPGPVVQMSSDSADGSITFKTPDFKLFIGKYATISPTSKQKEVRGKGYTFTSDDESIATVDAKGRVKAVSEGYTTILVASKALPDVWARISVTAAIPVKKLSIESDASSLYVGTTLQLSAVTDPADATDKAVTWKSSNKSIASIDENGLVTGLKPGTVTISATSTDGTKVHANKKITVAQRASGAKMKRAVVRVGVGNYTDNTAVFTPKGAESLDMQWTTSDESIATVESKGASVRVHGQKWGQCTVTGSTPDGSIVTSFTVNVGSLTRAVNVIRVKLSDKNVPQITVRNSSPMTMKSVTVYIRAYSFTGELLPISTDGDGTILKATYSRTLGPGESNHHSFKLIHVGDLNNIGYMEAAVVEWSCEEGYEDNNGKLQHRFKLSEKNYKWISMKTNSDKVSFLD